MNSILRFACLCFSLVIVIGCGTTRDNPANDPPLEITSEPPGAKIEINGEYIGETPWSGTFRRGMNYGIWENVMIKAFPVSPGQHVQIKFIPATQHTMPSRVYFNMNLVPVTPSIDVNINQ